jgi:bis(5'-nucleosidyl)-tetraphosphatase
MKEEHSAGVVLFIEKPVNEELKRFYLILNYRKGHWDLPKGKLEPGETNIQAAERELKEETGLTADIYPDFEHSLSYFFKDKGELIHKTVTFFVGKAHSEDVTLSPEHLYYKWLLLKDALREVTYINARQMLSMADQYISALER